MGVIEQSFFLPSRELYWSDVHLEVVGTAGSAHIKEPNDAAWIWTEEKVENPDLYLAPELHGKIGGALEAELAYFADCVIGGQTPELSSLQDAHEALRVGMAIVESAEKRKAIQLK